jgi:hypothetical protein
MPLIGIWVKTSPFFKLCPKVYPETFKADQIFLKAFKKTHAEFIKFQAHV